MACNARIAASVVEEFVSTTGGNSIAASAHPTAFASMTSSAIRAASAAGNASTGRSSRTVGLLAARTYSARTVRDGMPVPRVARTYSARTISDGSSVPRAVGPRRESDGDDNPKLQRSPTASLTTSRATTNSRKKSSTNSTRKMVEDTYAPARSVSGV